LFFAENYSVYVTQSQLAPESSDRRGHDRHFIWFYLTCLNLINGDGDRLSVLASCWRNQRWSFRCWMFAELHVVVDAVFVFDV